MCDLVLTFPLYSVTRVGLGGQAIPIAIQLRDFRAVPIFTDRDLAERWIRANDLGEPVVHRMTAEESLMFILTNRGRFSGYAAAIDPRGAMCQHVYPITEFLRFILGELGFVL